MCGQEEQELGSAPDTGRLLGETWKATRSVGQGIWAQLWSQMGPRAC